MGPRQRLVLFVVLALGLLVACTSPAPEPQPAAQQDSSIVTVYRAPT